MLLSRATYSAATRVATLTDLTDAEAPSGGAVVYTVTRRRPGYPDAVVVGPVSGPAVTTSALKDGVYCLLLSALDAGTEEEPISPPELIDVSDPLWVTADGETAERLSDAAEQRVRDYQRAGRDGDYPLDDLLSGYARRAEVHALVAESAYDAAHRLLRQPPAPTH